MMSYFPNEPPRRRFTKRAAQGSIPGAAEWRGYERDPDAKYAHGLLFGKSIAQATRCFGEGRSIERASELLVMPRAAFQYYVMAFSEFVRSGAAIGDSDSAACFLKLLRDREGQDPGSVTEIYPRLADTVRFVASRQGRFNAPPHIFGRFRDIAEELSHLLSPAR